MFDVRPFYFFIHMVRKIFISISFLSFIFSTAQATTVERVLAIVNNEAVTVSDYRKFMLQSGNSSSSDILDETVLKKLIDSRIILAEAKKAGIDQPEAEVSQYIKDFRKNNNMSDAEFRKGLADEGMTQKEYENVVRDNLITLRFIERELDSKIIVTEKEIDEYYRNNAALFTDRPERMSVRAIFIKISPSATLTEITDLKLKSLKIKAEIQKGEPFEKMVDAYAEDSFKPHDGMLGEFEKGAFLPELESSISSLKEGEISDPVWTNKGVYIFKVVKKIRGDITPLSLVRNEIYALLYRQKKEEKYNGWLKSLWEKSSVIIKR